MILLIKSVFVFVEILQNLNVKQKVIAKKHSPEASGLCFSLSNFWKNR